jgi:serine/threonine protein kinase
LVTLLAAEAEPLRVDLDRRGSALQSLPEEDRVWVADAGAELLAPLVGGESGIAGILTLGPKRSELPFSREDLLLLSALGGSVGIGLERQLLREAVDARALRVPEERAAAECSKCGRVEAPDTATCSECGGPARSCPLPQSPFGKYRLERRIGSGELVLNGAATESGLAGTPLYMSPEALAGERANPTFDLWSLGVVAFEAIAGRHPFEQDTPEETLQAIRSGRPIDLREAQPDCPEPIVNLLGKVLARERSRRPSTAREFANRLRSTAEAIAA